MHLLRSLAISTQHNLRVGTLARRLLGQSCKGLRPSLIAMLQVALNGSWIVDTLHRHVLSPNCQVESVEKWRTNQAADVAELDRTSCEDDGDGLAFSKLVAGDGPVVLTFAKLGAERTHRFKAFRLGRGKGGSRDGESEEGKGQQ